ncbi:VOC family protein [Lacrimispora sp. JR3]|uniref:VOC family protein n=1 Tax=Lacrimispora sinapis TaxID=3111456 RepID=UPI00374A4B0E
MNKNFLFTQIGYTYLPTANIERSSQWYEKYLGLKLIDKFEDRGSLIAILHYPHKHSIALVLVETTEHQPLSILRNGSPYPVLTMNCPNIETTYEKLKKQGAEVYELHSIADGEAKYFYFKDDQGNLLEAAWSKWDPVDEVKENFLI